MNRRQFLLLASQTALLGWSSSTFGAQNSKPKVIVVGAGMSGIAAARQLLTRGFEVELLEGRDRLGGRIHTSSALGIPIDLGASWIHGLEKNPITDLARQYKTSLIQTDAESSTVYQNGKRLSGSQLKRLDFLASRIKQSIKAAENSDVDIPIYDAVSQLLLNSRDKPSLEYLLSSTYEMEYAGSSKQLSSFYFDDQSEFGGPDALLREGYASLVTNLAEGLSVRYGKRVKEVITRENRVTVKTETESFEADYAIVTLPLGVLKSETVRFDPPLPEMTRVAIDVLGMGLLNKLVLKFEKPFWPDTDWIGRISRRPGEWTEWVSLQRPLGVPAIMGFSAAEFAKSLEPMSDKEIVASGLDALTATFGKSISPLVGAEVTRWGSDPFSLGSYSFHKVGAPRDVRSALRVPLSERVFLAGEATVSDHPSTVHGAYLSGIRTADRIAKQLLL